MRVHFEFVLDQLSRDSRHVCRLPCKHIPIVLQDWTSALSCLSSRLELMIVILRSSENSRLILFSFFCRPHRGHDQGFTRRDCKIFFHRLAISLCGKGYRGLDSESHLNGTPEAFSGTLEVSAHSDDPLRTWHFEYHIQVVRDGHEFRQPWPPNNGVVFAIETCHLKPLELSLVVL
jgi:hypothetical protein